MPAGISIDTVTNYGSGRWKTMRRPGSPGDLLDPWELWVRCATMAAVEAALPRDGHGDTASYSVHADGVTHDDSGGNTWTLALGDGGRAVLYGCDHEASRTRSAEPSLDLLADAPQWLPFARLRSLQRGFELGYVYWYDDGWHRVSYPAGIEDDGLAGTVGRVVDMQDLVLNATDVLLGYRLGEILDQNDENDGLAEILDETIQFAENGGLEEMVRQARERSVSAETFAWLARRWDLIDVVAALQLAHRAGLTPGSRIPRLSIA